jgi:hypothetical protein
MNNSALYKATNVVNKPAPPPKKKAKKASSGAVPPTEGQLNPECTTDDGTTRPKFWIEDLVDALNSVCSAEPVLSTLSDADKAAAKHILVSIALEFCWNGCSEPMAFDRSQHRLWSSLGAALRKALANCTTTSSCSAAAAAAAVTFPSDTGHNDDEEGPANISSRLLAALQASIPDGAAGVGEAGADSADEVLDICTADTLVRAKDLLSVLTMPIRMQMHYTRIMSTVYPAVQALVSESQAKTETPILATLEIIFEASSSVVVRDVVELGGKALQNLQAGHKLPDCLVEVAPTAKHIGFLRNARTKYTLTALQDLSDGLGDAFAADAFLAVAKLIAVENMDDISAFDSLCTNKKEWVSEWHSFLSTLVSKGFDSLDLAKRSELITLVAKAQSDAKAKAAARTAGGGDDVLKSRTSPGPTSPNDAGAAPGARARDPNIASFDDLLHFDGGDNIKHASTSWDSSVAPELLQFLTDATPTVNNAALNPYILKVICRAISDTLLRHCFQSGGDDADEFAFVDYSNVLIDVTAKPKDLVPKGTFQQGSRLCLAGNVTCSRSGKDSSILVAAIKAQVNERHRRRRRRHVPCRLLLVR